MCLPCCAGVCHICLCNHIWLRDHICFFHNLHPEGSPIQCCCTVWLSLQVGSSFSMPNSALVPLPLAQRGGPEGVFSEHFPSVGNHHAGHGCPSSAFYSTGENCSLFAVVSFYRHPRFQVAVLWNFVTGQGRFAHHSL